VTDAHARRAATLALALAAGCDRDPSFVEPPGGLRSESLAGCTWTSQGLFGEATSWSYDALGRLVQQLDTGEERLDRYRWRGDCLVAVDHLDADGEPLPPEDTSSNVDRFRCDPQDNPVRLERYRTRLRGQEVEELLVAASTWVNTYDHDGQLSRVERWDEGIDVDPVLVQTDDYTWVTAEHPLQTRTEQPQEGVSTTTTWLWDHDLLLGWSRSGSGSEIELGRTFDHRRLIEEYVSSEDEIELTVSWEYADERAPFPNRELRSGSDYESVDVAVDCGG
jgi:hypothetical protein